MNRWQMAMVAVALFMLAGVIEFATMLSPSADKNVAIGVGALFLCVGSLWIAIGAKYKKNAEKARRS